MSYVPSVYWTERGRTFEEEARARGWHDAQDTVLAALLARLHYRSVLDVGCGFGRVAAAIERDRTWTRYTGLDVSPDLVAGARAAVPTGEFICTDLATWEPTRQWDLVLAISVLGHLLPDDVPIVTGRLAHAARRDLVVMDWDAVGQQTEYQFGHDYRALLPDAEYVGVGALGLWHVSYR